MTCPFKGCNDDAENLDSLLAHVRFRHGAVAWTMATLRSAVREEKSSGESTL